MSVINSGAGSQAPATVVPLPLPQEAGASLPIFGGPLGARGQTTSSISSLSVDEIGNLIGLYLPKPPDKQSLPLPGEATAFSLFIPPVFESNRPLKRFEHFKIVVNVPLQFKDPTQAWGAMIDCLKMLEAAGSDNFQFLVVFGLNCSQKETELAAHVEKVAIALNAQLKQGKWRNIDSASVLGFSWEPAKGGLTNFVQFRNELLYSPETLAAIDNAKKKAVELSNSTVRLLSLDPDTEITKEAMEELADHWQDREAAVITAGFYEFNLPEPTNDVENFELLSIRIENVYDRAGKQELAKSATAVPIQYEPMPADLNKLVTHQLPLEPQLKRIISRNILFFQLNKEKSQDTQVALALYQELRDRIKVLNTSLQRPIKGEDLVKKEIASNLGSIREIQSRFSSLTGALFPINGRDILYPPECALFVSLYENETRDEDKEGKQSEKMELWDAHMRARPEKRWDLWGTQGGRGEGANLSMQVQRARRREALLRIQESRPAVDFPWSFVTAVPPRNRFDKIRQVMMQNLLSRGLIGDVIETLYQSFLYKSQSFLSLDFATQRVHFVEGSSVWEPKSYTKGRPIMGNFSPYPIGVRGEVATAVKRWILEIQKMYRTQAQCELEVEVLRLFNKTNEYSRRDLVQSLIDAVCNTTTAVPRGREYVVVYSDDILNRILSYLQ